MDLQVYNFLDYKDYLRNRLETKGQGRGSRAKLAKALDCQPGFVSQVLNSYTHFSLEQAVLINDFLGHNENEADFFLLLVEYTRAGSTRLAEVKRKKIEERKEELALIKERIKIQEGLSRDDQAKYYSSWLFSAIHMLVLCPEYRTKGSISNYLNIPLATVSESLEFLIECGLIQFNNDEYTPGSKRIHISDKSVHINQHHTNWRLQAIQTLGQRKSDNLHYSLVACLSHKDVEKCKKLILNVVEQFEKVLPESPEETICCIAFDLFSIGQEGNK